MTLVTDERSQVDGRPGESLLVPRRTVLRTGVVSAVGLGAAACTAGDPTAAGTGAGTAPGRSPQPPSTPTSPSAPGSAPSAAAGAPAHSPGGPGPVLLRTPGPDIRTGPVDRPAVALTFHGAGQPGLTQRVLATCAAYDARITVFAVGQWLAANPALGRAIVRGGHDLGNHTWSHQTMPRLGAAAARAEVADGARAVAAVAGASPLLFRPSGTPASTPLIREAAAASGYARCVSYNVDPADYQDPGRDAVARRTIGAMRPGSIISLHLGHAGTAQALPAILQAISDRSLHAVTVTALLG